MSAAGTPFGCTGAIALSLPLLLAVSVLAWRYWLAPGSLTGFAPIRRVAAHTALTLIHGESSCTT